MKPDSKIALGTFLLVSGPVALVLVYLANSVAHFVLANLLK